MNNIDRWLRDNGHSYKTLARRVRINPNSFRRYLSGWRLPTWPTMDRIEKVTEGGISPNDFLALYRRRAKAAKKRQEAPSLETPTTTEAPIAAE